MARLVLLATAATLLLSACGASDPKLPPACIQGPQTILSALAAAPGPVRLHDGTRLSTCVADARADADLQNLGVVLTQTANTLAGELPRSDPAALQLGYLVGATRRGAAHTSGIHETLQRRIEQTTGIDGPPAHRRAAYRRGLAAGSRTG